MWVILTRCETKGVTSIPNAVSKVVNSCLVVNLTVFQPPLHAYTATVHIVQFLLCIHRWNEGLLGIVFASLFPGLNPMGANPSQNRDFLTELLMLSHWTTPAQVFQSRLGCKQTLPGVLQPVGPCLGGSLSRISALQLAGHCASPPMLMSFWARASRWTCLIQALLCEGVGGKLSRMACLTIWESSYYNYYD